MRRLTAAASILFIVLAIMNVFADESVFLCEDFRSLENWKPLYFPKIKVHTKYSLETEGSSHYLKAESNASASALVNIREINIYKYPKVRWRWKVSNVYEKAVTGTKGRRRLSDRVYILFKYDPGRLRFLEKIKYNAAKVIYGEYPPDSTLNYVWASSNQTPNIMPNPYTDRARLIALEKGPSKAGEWVDESVNILEDYRKAFGADPPSTARIAIMNDSDNTGEKSVSYIGFIEVYR